MYLQQMYTDVDNTLPASTLKDMNKKLGNTAVICLSPYYGGMEMDAVRIAKILTPFSKVTLIVKKNSLLEKNIINDHSLQLVHIKSISFFTNFSINLILTARNIIKKENIKNVIFFGASELKSLYFSMLNIDINFVIRHNTTKSTPKKDFFHRLIYSKVNYHVAICQHLANNVKEIIPFGEKATLKLIYSSLRQLPESTEKPDNKNKTLYLLHIGRIAEGKGQIDAIKACDILYKKEIKFALHLVGDIVSEYQKDFINFLDTVPYKDSIILEGFSTKINDFYKKADIFLFPSWGEGLSNSFIEALAHGIICISYNNTSFPELRELGFNIFMAKDRDIEDLKCEIEKAVIFYKKNSLPIKDNIQLAKTTFNKEKELSSIIDILI